MHLVSDRFSGRVDEVFDVMFWSGVKDFRRGDRRVVGEHVGETQDLGNGNAMGADGAIDDVVETFHSEALKGGGIHQVASSHVDKEVVVHQEICAKNVEIHVSHDESPRQMF